MSTGAKTAELQNSSIRPRDVRLDALRGFAVTAVVLGHCLVRAVPPQLTAGPGLQFEAGVGFVPVSVMSGVLLNVIYSFHIPLFAFVSGQLLHGSRQGAGWRLIKSRFASLMVPYFAWMMVAWAFSGPWTLSALLRYVAAGAVNDQAPGALWFLYALFMSTVVYAAVRSTTSSGLLLAFSALLVGFAGILPIPAAHQHSLGLSEVAWVYPFVIAGYFAAVYRPLIDGSRVLQWVAPIVWILTLPLVWPVAVAGERWWLPHFAAWISALVPAPAILAKGAWAVARVVGAMAGVLTAYFGFAYIRGGFMKWAAWLGTRSIGVYAAHGFFLLTLGATVAWLRVGVMFALAMAGSIGLTLLLERTAPTRRVFLGQSR